MTNNVTVDWDADVAVDDEEVYESLVRAIVRTEGFGLFFVRCVERDRVTLERRLKNDLPSLQFERLELIDELIDGNLYRRVAEVEQQLGPFNGVFISGLEKSLDPYVKSGYGGLGDYYNKDTVPRVLGHLNLQRERFRDDFPFCLIFFLSAFGIKYIARRAPDFFDWRSGLFEFVPDSAVVDKLTLDLIGKYDEYLTWTEIQRLDRIREMQALIDEDWQSPEGKADLFFEKGSILLASQSYEESLSSFDKTTELNPSVSQFWYARGYALGNLNRYEEAIASYDKVIELKPDDHSAWYNRGVALGNLNRHEEAIASFDKAIELKPDHYNAWGNRGNALGNLNRHEEAITSYDKVIELKPDYYNAWGNRGNALRKLNRYEEAIASYDKVIELKPDDHSAWYNLGVAIRKLNRHEEAITSFDKAIELKPDHYNAWCARGNALGNLNRHEEAITSYDKAIELKPDHHNAWHGRGCALGNLNRYEEAIASYDKAIELKPDDQNAWFNRACAHSLRGTINLAFLDLAEAFRLNPEETRKFATTDPDLEPLRQDPRFENFLGLASST
jgi:tetratricopeptide (TPR) repeat protein